MPFGPRCSCPRGDAGEIRWRSPAAAITSSHVPSDPSHGRNACAAVAARTGSASATSAACAAAPAGARAREAHRAELAQARRPAWHAARVRGRRARATALRQRVCARRGPRCGGRRSSCRRASFDGACRTPATAAGGARACCGRTAARRTGSGDSALRPRLPDGDAAAHDDRRRLRLDPPASAGNSGQLMRAALAHGPGKRSVVGVSCGSRARRPVVQPAAR